MAIAVWKLIDHAAIAYPEREIVTKGAVSLMRTRLHDVRHPLPHADLRP